jgi:alpha-amylase/alpha-mannosidase (GH57 family)
VLKDPTAEPYHDWNECVYQQCYKPNIAARLLDESGRIAHISGNYRHMSFNVGPTLHRWIEERDPLLNEGILKADGDARDALGAGGAVAQAYNHIIMPLACERDIRTQVKWGAADFTHRFGRKPDGMWLPETAVDTATLEALAEEGVKFTILAPHQCAAVRTQDGKWSETPGGSGLDVTKPYYTRLPSGRIITLIFYLGSIAHDIAFGGLLNNGDAFAQALISRLPRGGEPCLLTIATDGETYGHHHHFGEMALARAAQVLYASQDVMLTNIASFLRMYPASRECKIAEMTSWSCAHGVERWRSDCGCHTGGEAWWNQAWRAPLREALDNVRDRIDEIYEREMKPLCGDPWALRDEAIALYLGGSPAGSAEETAALKRDFLKKRCGNLSDRDLRKALTMIESQRMRMFMYTSCGWFFNDISGVETRQILSYASRAIEYALDVSGVDIGVDFMKDLKKVRGNTAELPTAYDVMVKTVFPNHRTIRDIAAMASLMKADKRYYAFVIERGVQRYSSAGMNMEAAEMRITDARTFETWRGCSMVITSGGLDDVCRLTEGELPDKTEMWKNFYLGDIFSVSKFIEDKFELGPWHLSNLTIDDGRVVARERTRGAEEEYMEYARSLLEENQRILAQLRLMRAESAPFLTSVGEFVHTRLIERLCEKTESILDLLESGSELEEIIARARDIGITPRLSALAPNMESAFCGGILDAYEKNDEDAFGKLLRQWRMAVGLGIDIDKWRMQNIVWEMLEKSTTELPDVLLKLAGELGFALPGR